MAIMDLIEKSKKNRQKKIRHRAIKNAAFGAAIGVSLGAAAGVLLAPKSGKETRDDIVKGARELPDKAQKIVEKTKVKVEEAKEKLKEKKNKTEVEEVEQ